MASSPQIKIYTASGQYEGCVKHYESAAALVSMLGDGSTIRSDHSAKSILWIEGVDGQAGESYDGCAAHCSEKRNQQKEEGKADLARRIGAWKVHPNNPARSHIPI